MAIALETCHPPRPPVLDARLFDSLTPFPPSIFWTAHPQHSDSANERSLCIGLCFFVSAAGHTFNWSCVASIGCSEANAWRPVQTRLVHSESYGRVVA